MFTDICFVYCVPGIYNCVLLIKSIGVGRDEGIKRERTVSIIDPAQITSLGFSSHPLNSDKSNICVVLNILWSEAFCSS